MVKRTIEDRIDGTHASTTGIAGASAAALAYYAMLDQIQGAVNHAFKINAPGEKPTLVSDVAKGFAKVVETRLGTRFGGQHIADAIENNPLVQQHGATSSHEAGQKALRMGLALLPVAAAVGYDMKQAVDRLHGVMDSARVAIGDQMGKSAEHVNLIDCLRSDNLVVREAVRHIVPTAAANTAGRITGFGLQALDAARGKGFDPRALQQNLEASDESLAKAGKDAVEGKIKDLTGQSEQQNNDGKQSTSMGVKSLGIVVAPVVTNMLHEWTKPDHDAPIMTTLMKAQKDLEGSSSNRPAHFKQTVTEWLDRLYELETGNAPGHSQRQDLAEAATFFAEEIAARRLDFNDLIGMSGYKIIDAYGQVAPLTPDEENPRPSLQEMTEIFLTRKSMVTHRSVDTEGMEFAELSPAEQRQQYSRASNYDPAIAYANNGRIDDHGPGFDPRAAALAFGGSILAAIGLSRGARQEVDARVQEARDQRIEAAKAAAVPAM